MKNRKKLLIFAAAGFALLAGAAAAILIFGGGGEGGQAAYPHDEGAPYLVEPKYGEGKIVIAEVIATHAPYLADPTGQSDSAPAIQRAIDDCQAMGGGTVWLPEGSYLLKSPVSVHSFVTLRGDWNDPDTGGEYGTVILAAVPSSEEITPGLFTIGGSAGVRGLTVYYPEQSIENPVPYPFTFYIPGGVGGQGYYMLQSVADCTVINGYRGVGACVNDGVHEMMTIENLKGTFLSVGAEAYNQADVGTWKNVVIDNRYWAEARGGLAPAPRAELDAYTAENAVGLMLGDLEWTQFTGISISGRKIGVNIVKGKRIEFAGAFFDVNIENCGVGLRVDSIDGRWGMVAASGKIEGVDAAVENNTRGAVKLAGIALSGPVLGELVEEDDSLGAAVLELPNEPEPRAAVWDAAKFYGADRAGQRDAAPGISRAAAAAGAAGGGIVYLPAGKYRIETPVEIPAGVELRGCSGVAVRSQNDLSLGTVLLAYYGEADSREEARDARALITLAGPGAGIRGLYIIYPENPPENGAVKPYSYAVRGSDKGVYAVNISIGAAYNGIDFRGADNHLIKKLVSGCYDNAILAGNSVGGVIEGCLQNGTVVTRQALGLDPWISEGDIFSGLFDPVTRPGAVYLRLEGARDQTVASVFAYGVATLIDAKDSEGLLAVNIGADNIGKGSPLLKTSGGDALVVNMMRYNGISYENEGTDLRIYNRLSILEFGEENVK